MSSKVSKEVEAMRAEHVGTSQGALDAAKSIFSLNGLAHLRQGQDAGMQCYMVAEFARIIERDTTWHRI